MSTSNPIAIVTGASTGIGKHISIKLSQNNFHVILISRNKLKLRAVEKKIKEDGFDCSTIIADISKNDSFDKMTLEINKHKRIDVLVNNAGIGVFNKIEDTLLSDWDSQINTNLRGSFIMTKMVVKDMIENKSGKIVFINSVAGLKPYPFSSGYVASKYGLRGFAASLREELREHNIKVISIHPGAIDTPFWDNVKADFPRSEMLSSEDVANSIVEAILAKNNVVHEELVIRRTAGDF